jgi:hypothetical protein
MLPVETWVAIRGYTERRNEDFKDEWERVRWHAAVMVNVWSKKKIEPSRLKPFPWEGADSGSAPEDIESLRKEMGWQEPEH